MTFSIVSNSTRWAWVTQILQRVTGRWGGRDVARHRAVDLDHFGDDQHRVRPDNGRRRRLRSRRSGPPAIAALCRHSDGSRDLASLAEGPGASAGPAYWSAAWSPKTGRPSSGCVPGLTASPTGCAELERRKRRGPVVKPAKYDGPPEERYDLSRRSGCRGEVSSPDANRCKICVQLRRQKP